MMMTISLAIAAFAAYWVYTDARRVGHESGTALMWALGTLVFMIVFLPLYLLLGRKPKNVRHQQPEPVIDVEAEPAGEPIYCPMCGSKVKEDFKTCPYCSHTLRPKCEKCGQELRREWKTCPYCEAPAKDK